MEPSVTKLLAAALIMGSACGGGEVLTPPPPPPPPPPSAPPTVSLSGTVFEERNGQGVSGAVIAVAGVTATTGSAGQFTILGLSTGSATLAVTAPGFDPLSKGISLNAGANTVTLTLMPVNTLYQLGAFDIYIPSEVSTVRGVFFVLFGGNGDSRPMIRRDFDYYRIGSVPPEFAAVLPGYRSSLMAFARAQGFAVMGMTTPGGPGGLHTEIRQALGEASSISGHPELAHASLILQGHSRGGCMAYQVAGQDPERVIGVIPMAPQGVQPCLNGLLPASVPAYFILGELDIPSENTAATNGFEQKRGSGAIWALAIERGVGHAWTANHNLVFSWSAAVAARRLPQTIPPGTPVTLLQVSQASGWLGDRISGSVAGYACFTGDQVKASWLPSEQTARDWQLVASGLAPTVTVCAP
jgi:pimeloyl-ACP methyl ester carboxylesterase